jgi:iron complex outermembrane receptor protein
MFNGSVAIQGDFQYRSEHFFSLTKAPASTEDGYVIGNGRLSYTTDDDRWEAAVFVQNIADEEYLVQTFDLGFILGMTEQYYGLPRWVGGSIRFNWD